MPPSKPDLLHCFMDQKFSSLPDVQSLADGRNIPIDRVGVRDLTVPLTIASINGPQPTIAEVSMYVGLPADKRARTCRALFPSLPTILSRCPPR